MSRAECTIPLRNFLGTPYGPQIAKSCGNVHASWVMGACITISAGLLYANYVTLKQQDDFINDPANKNPVIVIPTWLALLPILYAFYVAIYSQQTFMKHWESEVIHFNSSEMNKSDFLNYRRNDDRQQSSGSISLANTGIIGSAALFGPFLRADNR